MLKGAGPPNRELSADVSPPLPHPGKSRPFLPGGAALVSIAALTTAFYWRVLSSQFPHWLGFEGVNQGYAWLNFWAATVKQGGSPIWDPFTWSGRPFPAEMQTGAFYPLYLVFALLPFDHGMLSLDFYRGFYVLTHILAGCFMYLLVRELGLSLFAALLSGVCFALGGIGARLPDWPHLAQSGIWLPLILLFFTRAMKARETGRAIAYSALSGLCLAVSVLAGGLHFVVMQTLVTVAAAGFLAAHLGSAPERRNRAVFVRRSALLVAVFLLFALAGGAVQLLSTGEYSPFALRWIGSTAIPATAKIPYSDVGNGLSPHSFLEFIVPVLPAPAASGEALSPYLGIFPVMLAVVAVWKRWNEFWVRFFAGATLVALLYSLGSWSFLHGFLYAVTPFLWSAREAGRFLYVADAGLMILAAYGAETLLWPAPSGSWASVNRAFRWAPIGCAVALGYYALLGHGELSRWASTAALFLILSYGLFRYVIGGHRGAWPRFLMISLIAFDLYAFDSGVTSVLEAPANGPSQFSRLLSTRGVANFLRSRTDHPRVEVLADSAPNLGDAFAIETVTGPGVTVLQDYSRLIAHRDLLDLGYLVRPASSTDPNPIYQDSFWKVYETKPLFPRAWLVHDVAVEPDPEKLWNDLDTGAYDLRRTALLAAPLDEALQPPPAEAESVDIPRLGLHESSIGVHARNRALLVWSDVYYPGWKASVNGRAAAVHKVDGGLRGIVVPGGESRVRVYYAPASLRLGSALSLAAFLGGGLLALARLRKHGP